MQFSLEAHPINHDFPVTVWMQFSHKAHPINHVFPVTVWMQFSLEAHPINHNFPVTVWMQFSLEAHPINHAFPVQMYKQSLARRGGGVLAILCVLGMCRPQGYVFHSFCLGRCCFQPSSLARVCFSRFLTGNGVVFRPNSLARGVFWSWFDTKILARVVVLRFFSGKGGKFLSGKGKGMLPWAAHPYP